MKIKVKSQMGRGILCLISAQIFLLQNPCLSSLNAQSPSLTFVLEQVEDSLYDIVIYYGTESVSVENENAISGVFSPTGKKISPSSQIVWNFDGSWLFENEGTHEITEISDDSTSISIDISRLDAVNQSGYGEVARGGGVVVTVADVNRFGASNPSIAPSWNIYPNPCHHKLQINWDMAFTPDQIVITDLYGNTLARYAPAHTLPLHTLVPGTYWISLMNREIKTTKRLVITR